MGMLRPCSSIIHLTGYSVGCASVGGRSGGGTCGEDEEEGVAIVKVVVWDMKLVCFLGNALMQQIFNFTDGGRHGCLIVGAV